MEFQEVSSGLSSTSRDFAGSRSLGDAEEQTDHQIAPEQADELLSKLGGTTGEQSCRLSPAHDCTQDGASGLPSYRVDRAGNFGRPDRFADGEPEYRDHSGLAYLLDELGSERSQCLRERLPITDCRKVGRQIQTLGPPADGCNE